jgi:hypothetical protein
MQSIKIDFKNFFFIYLFRAVNFFNFCSKAGAWEPAGNTAVKVNFHTRSQAPAWECN